MRKQILLVVRGLLFSFETWAQLNGSGFYRIRNVERSADVISIENDEFNYQTIVGSASSTYSDPTAAINRAITFLQKDLLFKDNVTSIFTPSTVLYLQKKSSSKYDKQYDVKGQGTSLVTLTTGEYVGNTVGTVSFYDIYAKIDASGTDTDTITIELKGYGTSGLAGWIYPNGYSLGNYYLQDASGKMRITKTKTDNTIQWYIEPITAESETNYFAAKPADKMKEGGKYYTSLTTAFAYEIVGDVNAYIVTGVEQKDGKQVATMKLVGGQGKIIPAYTPVILECTSTDPALNKLQPTTSAGNVDVSGNKLHGVLLKNKYKSSDNATLAAITKPTRLRVFNVNNSGKVGFYKYSGTDLSANKVYLDMADFANASSNEFDGTFTMDFSQTVSGVNEVHVEETVKDDRYYDLQGRVVEHPTRGIYIRNGRKVFVN